MLTAKQCLPDDMPAHDCFFEPSGQQNEVRWKSQSQENDILLDSMSGLTLTPNVGQEIKVDIKNWRRTVSQLTIPDSPRKRRTDALEMSYLVSLHGGSEDVMECQRDLWYEIMEDEIVWIHPIYLGSSRGDSSRNSHLLEIQETGRFCHPLNPRQFQRLVELQGWEDFERMAQYRVQENIGSLLRGSERAILKLLHKIEEYQLYPESGFEGLPQESSSTGCSPSSSPTRPPTPEDHAPCTIRAPPPSATATPSRRCSLAGAEAGTLYAAQLAALAALAEWEASLDAREALLEDEMGWRRSRVALLEQEVGRCCDLVALGFSVDRLNTEMLRAQRDVEWFGCGGRMEY
jgi:hypothetical protein